MSQIIAIGAEAILIKENNKLIKRRIKKSYRLPEIDEKLRKKRTKIEAKLLEKLENKINVPKIIKLNEGKKEIVMEFIEGKKLSEHLDSFKPEEQEKIMKQIGSQVSILHDSGIIHADLTTSNMILVEDNSKKELKTKKLIKQVSKSGKNLFINKQITDFKVYFVDFGLSFHSKRIEDKAVDLHLLKQALESRHFSCWEKLFKSILLGYNPKPQNFSQKVQNFGSRKSEHSEDFLGEKEKILKQLEKVEKRGRYKH